MPLDISSNAIIEKNKLTSKDTWLFLIEVIIEGEGSVRGCLNNTQITWDGYIWEPMIFNVSGITETKDAEIPSISLTVFDPLRVLVPLLEEYDGAIGSETILRVIHSKYLDNTTPELEESTEIIEASVDESAQISFKLGAENLSTRRCPQQRYLKNNCRFNLKQAELSFTSGGVETPIVNQYLQGDTSGNQAKIVEVRLYSGSFSGGDAAGIIRILTISGGFTTETLSLYSDSGFTTLVQSNIASISSSSSGRCGYIGVEISCDRSFNNCKVLSNKQRYGAFPSVGGTGFLV